MLCFVFGKTIGIMSLSHTSSIFFPWPTIFSVCKNINSNECVPFLDINLCVIISPPFPDLATLRCEQPDQDCPLTAVTPSEKTPTLDLQQKRAPSLYPDGIFLAELIDICSPDEGEEEGEDK